MDEQPKKHPMLEQVQNGFSISDASMSPPATSAFQWPMPKKPFSVQPGKKAGNASRGPRASKSSKSRGRRSQDWGY